MSEQSRRVAAERRKSELLGDKFLALGLRVRQFRDSQFYNLDANEEKLLLNMEQALLAMSRARVGALDRREHERIV